jgi:hypothetical protein
MVKITIVKVLRFLLKKLNSDDIALLTDRNLLCHEENTKLQKDILVLRNQNQILLERISQVNQSGFQTKADIVNLLHNIQQVVSSMMSKFSTLPDYKKLEKNFMEYHINTRAEVDSFKIMLKNYFKTIQYLKIRSLAESELYRTLSTGFNKLSGYENSTNSAFDKVSMLLDVGYSIQDDLEFVTKIVKEMPEIIKSIKNLN